jgi:flagellar hook-associated protein 3 FlgL
MYGIYRTTQRSLADQVTLGLQTNLDRLGSLQAEISSGRRIMKPSDDPSGVDSAMLLRSQTRSATQAGRNAADGVAWLGAADTALSGMMSSLQHARDLTVQGSSTGSNDPTSLAAIAGEIDQLRTSLIGDANTTYLGRPVFGGTTAGSRAYDSTGTYVGDGGSVKRSVGDGVQIQVDTNGPQAFGSGASGVFGVLATISADLKTNPSALAADLNNLDAAMKGVSAAQSDVGARYKRVDAAQTKANNLVLTLKGQLGDVENVDLPKAIVDLQLAQNAYQAALGASSKVITTSLMDFLR